MGWGSSDVVRFDLEPPPSLLQGQTRTKRKSAYNSLIICPWARNLLMWSDFALGPSFKVNENGET